MATYYVYVNWRTRGYRARVHFAHCAFCNAGAGIHPRATNRSGWWCGPFATLEKATTAAQQLARYRGACKRCKPA